MGTFRKAAGLVGAVGVAMDHPWMTAGAVVGIAGIASYGTTEQQAAHVTPDASMQRRPGSSGGDDYNLGGTGDLIFALHRNR